MNEIEKATAAAVAADTAPESTAKPLPEPDLMGESNEEHYALPEKPTKRAYALRRFLVESIGEGWISARRIYEVSLIWEESYSHPENSSFTGTVGKQIQKDVETLNLSGEFDRIIVSKRGTGDKLATKEEFERFYRSETLSNRRSLWKLGIMKHAADRDGQGILPDPNHPYQREFHQSFSEGGANK